MKASVSKIGGIKASSLWIIGIVIAVLVLGVGFYLWHRSSVEAVSITTNLDQNPATVGIPLTVKIDLSNNSGSDIGDMQLSVSLPQSLPLADGSGASMVNKSIGNISKGSTNEQTLQLIPLPDPNNTRTVTITASYTLGSLSARFQTASNLNINVQNLPLTLALTAPSTVFSGEQFETTAAYGRSSTGESNLDSSSTQFPPLSVNFIYPDTFSLVSADPSPGAANGDIWLIGPLNNGDVGKILVRGKISLPDQTQFVMSANLSANILGQNYVIASSSAPVTVNVSPLSLDITLNNSTSTVAQSGDTLNYTLSYKNNTQVAFQAVVIKADIAGSMLDMNTLQYPGGNFDPNRDAITWDSNSTPSLGSIAPGASGTVTFSVALDKSYPIFQLNDKDFSARVNATITSPTVPYLITADQTINTASSVTKIGGEILVDANGYFRDAPSGLINSGPWPPKVGTATEYTIHWKLTNYSTDLSNVQVEAQLSPGVTFTGQSSANTSSTPQYASSTNQIVWSVGSLPATSGILTTAPEAIFQVSATPQSSNIGQYMDLLEPTVLTAQDDFTGLQLTAGSPAVSTLLPSDTTVTSGQGLVTN